MGRLLAHVTYFPQKDPGASNSELLHNRCLAGTMSKEEKTGQSEGSRDGRLLPGSGEYGRFGV